jgi:uncharacterized protein (DUF302 family)
MKTQQKTSEKDSRKIAYGYRRELDMPFEDAVRHTRAALADEGFGILCEIDIKEKLKEKLGIDFRKYVILGSCNPPLAFEALQEEIDLGLLLPCNVVVYEEDSRAVVSAIDASKMMSVVGNEKLNKTAQLVNEKLHCVIDGL